MEEQILAEQLVVLLLRQAMIMMRQLMNMVCRILCMYQAVFPIFLCMLDVIDNELCLPPSYMYRSIPFQSPSFLNWKLPSLNAVSSCV